MFGPEMFQCLDRECFNVWSRNVLRLDRKCFTFGPEMFYAWTGKVLRLDRKCFTFGPGFFLRLASTGSI